MCRGDDPVAIDNATAARMRKVGPLDAALPRPWVRFRFFASDDALSPWTNSTLHGYNHHSNAVLLNRRNGQALNLHLFNVQPTKLFACGLGTKGNFKKQDRNQWDTGFRQTIIGLNRRLRFDYLKLQKYKKSILYPECESVKIGLILLTDHHTSQN